MKTLLKAALGVIGLGLLGGCQPYDGYGGGGYYGGDAGFGYCAGFGCPDDYWDQPLYYGSVYYGGSWRNGPFYYRDWNGGRQYWLGGNWRNDDWRGARPQQYRDGRTGPALGREWYRNNQNVQNRPGFNGNRPDNQPRPGFNRNDANRNDNAPRDGGNRGRNQAEIQQQRSQQSAPPPDRFGRDSAASPPSPRPPQTSRGRGRSE